jgi:hypothetical protein
VSLGNAAAFLLIAVLAGTVLWRGPTVSRRNTDHGRGSIFNPAGALSALRAWWLKVRCGCGRTTQIPVGRGARFVSPL